MKKQRLIVFRKIPNPEVATKVDTMCSPNRFCSFLSTGKSQCWSFSPKKWPETNHTLFWRLKFVVNFLADWTCCAAQSIAEYLTWLVVGDTLGRICSMSRRSVTCSVLWHRFLHLPLIVSTEGIISWKSATSWGDNGTAANAMCHPVCAFGSLTFHLRNDTQRENLGNHYLEIGVCS